MNARLQKMQGDAAAWEKANKGWDRGLTDESPLPPPYVTPGLPDSEPYDLRRAVSEPPVGKDGLPLRNGKKPRQRHIKFANFDNIAPAQIMTDEDLKKRVEAEAVEDAMTERAAAVRAWALREYNGDYPEVLDLVMLRRVSTAQIARETGYTERHIGNILHGNPARPNTGGGLVAFLADFLEKVWHEDVPVSLQPVKTGKRHQQKGAVVAQMAWVFEAMGEA